MDEISKNKVRVFETADKIADVFAEELKNEINKISSEKGIFHLAVSGGSTPEKLFKLLGSEKFKDEIFWHNVHIYWCDERMVLPDDEESNFGMTKKLLLDNIIIPGENIHRIKGENDPEEEIKRYTEEIKSMLNLKMDDLPEFDHTLLGIGEDGHTASLFPDKKLVVISNNICGIAIHPDTGQQRISLTHDAIINSKKISFLVTGKNKKDTLKKILENDPESLKYPAAKINRLHKNVEWLIDEDAAS